MLRFRPPHPWTTLSSQPANESRWTLVGRGGSAATLAELNDPVSTDVHCRGGGRFGIVRSAARLASESEIAI